MRFISAVRIRDFRSIANAEVAPLGDTTPVVGLNGSGKSNFLRALNLFFNDVVEPDQAFDLRRDFREPGRKAKLRIVVELDLDYDQFGALREEHEESLKKLSEGYSVITFRKEWTLHPVTREQVVTLSAGPLPDELVEVSPENVPYATRLLNCVRFRYVPNHVHPTQILRAEQEAIRRLLFDRLGQQKLLSERTVKQIASGAADLMRPIRDAMAEAMPDIGDVELATPSDWRELAWAFGLKLRSNQSQSFEALLHGSGVQSVLAYQILHVLDTTFSGSFGWRKGAVWAVEEPESFLHARLQAELARSFADYTVNQPLQIVLSTHSPAFLGTSSEGVTVGLDSGGRSELAMKDRSELIRIAYSTGITPFSHPLHTGPPKPLLLVEGKTDRDLIVSAFRLGSMVNPYEILCLEDFDETMAGGDQIAPWLRYNREALEARPSTSPVVVLLDWEAKLGLVASIEKALAAHATSRCVKWPNDLVNADLSENWAGIERFLATSFVEHLRDTGVLSLLAPVAPDNPTWLYTVEKKKLNAAKAEIHRQLESRQRRDDIAPLIAALPWLVDQLKDLPPLL